MINNPNLISVANKIHDTRHSAMEALRRAVKSSIVNRAIYEIEYVINDQIRKGVFDHIYEKVRTRR